jgi:hypothetical protein
MNKTYQFFRGTAIMLFLLMILSIITTCKKNKDMVAVVTVKLQSDTTKTVPYAKVVLHKQDVFIEGTTDAAGEFRHTFELEAILDITACKDSSFTGNAVIRLKPEKTIYKTVLVHPGKCN